MRQAKNLRWVLRERKKVKARREKAVLRQRARFERARASFSRGKQPKKGGWNRFRRAARRFVIGSMIVGAATVGHGIISSFRKQPLPQQKRPAAKAPAGLGAGRKPGLGQAPAKPVHRTAGPGPEPNRPVQRPAVQKPVAEPKRPAVRRVAEPNKPPVKKPVAKADAKAPAAATTVFPVASAKMSVLLPKGARCLSAKQIDEELAKRGSPAVGLGKVFVKWGRHYGIRPAVALAFFRKESNWGTRGIAVKTKAIGNIRYTPTSGSGVRYTNYKGFRKYEAWEHGIQDWFWLISSKGYAGGNLKTLEKIIPKYAPGSENNPKAYQRLVFNYLNELYKNASK